MRYVFGEPLRPGPVPGKSTERSPSIVEGIEHYRTYFREAEAVKEEKEEEAEDLDLLQKGVFGKGRRCGLDQKTLEQELWSLLGGSGPGAQTGGGVFAEAVVGGGHGPGQDPQQPGGVGGGAAGNTDPLAHEEGRGGLLWGTARRDYSAKEVLEDTRVLKKIHGTRTRIRCAKKVERVGFRWLRKKASLSEQLLDRVDRMVKDREETHETKMVSIMPSRVIGEKAVAAAGKFLRRHRLSAEHQRKSHHVVYMAQVEEFSKYLRLLSDPERPPIRGEVYLSEAFRHVLNAGMVVDEQYFFRVLDLLDVEDFEAAHTVNLILAGLVAFGVKLPDYLGYLKEREVDPFLTQAGKDAASGDQEKRKVQVNLIGLDQALEQSQRSRGRTGEPEEPGARASSWPELGGGGSSRERGSSVLLARDPLPFIRPVTQEETPQTVSVGSGPASRDEDALTLILKSMNFDRPLERYGFGLIPEGEGLFDSEAGLQNMASEAAVFGAEGDSGAAAEYAEAQQLLSPTAQRRASGSPGEVAAGMVSVELLPDGTAAAGAPGAPRGDLLSPTSPAVAAAAPGGAAPFAEGVGVPAQPAGTHHAAAAQPQQAAPPPTAPPGASAEQQQSEKQLLAPIPRKPHGGPPPPAGSTARRGEHVVVPGPRGPGASPRQARLGASQPGAVRSLAAAGSGVVARAGPSRPSPRGPGAVGQAAHVPKPGGKSRRASNLEKIPEKPVVESYAEKMDH